MELYVLIGGLGLIVGFLSGLLGIGGGIVMAPLLLYVPPLFGHDPLPMRLVAGLTIVQGLAACISGAMAHRKFHFLSGRLALWMGTTIFLAAFLGGAAANCLSNSLLLLIFALLASVAAVLIILPNRKDREDPDVEDFSFSRFRAMISAGSVGLFGGMVGQGGSFILIPLMTSYMQVPTRIAIGSNLAIVFLATLAAFFGKAVTGQIAWALTLPLVVAVVPAAYVGGLVSRRIPVAGLRLLLGTIIGAAAVRIAIQALGSG